MKFFREVVDTSTWLAAFRCCVEKFDIVGSALYVEEPKDVDFAVLLKPEVSVSDWCEDRTSRLKAKDSSCWQNCCEEYEKQKDDDWQALRQGHVNLLVTNDPEWYADMVTAAQVCAALGLERKSDRVRVHRVIRDRMPWEQAKAAPMREGVVD